jgi:hypothetical protein
VTMKMKMIVHHLIEEIMGKFMSICLSIYLCLSLCLAVFANLCFCLSLSQ